MKQGWASTVTGLLSAVAATEVLVADDGTAETVVSDNGVIVVNRLTPSVYPATLQAIRLIVPRVAGLPTPVGSQLKLVAFVGAAGTARPTANPTFVVNQVVTIPEAATTGFIDFTISNGPTITSGDFYVGFQTPTPFGGVVFAADVNGTPRQRAYVSSNNGASFSGPLTLQGTTTPINVLIRAVVANDVPATSRIDVPASFGFSTSNVGIAQQQNLPVVNIGGAALTITSITSNNPQFTIVSPSLPATIAAGAQSQIGVRFTPTGAGLQTGTLTIASNDPATPAINIALSGLGGSATVPSTVFITSDAAVSGSIASPPSGSKVLFDTQYAIFVPPGITQLKLDLTGTQDVDLFARFNQRITLSGTTIVADHSSTNGNTLPETIIITPGGLPALQSGLYYIAVDNFGPGAATFTLSVTMTGGTGSGAVAAVSAASYLGTEASAEQIVALFGANLATGTQIADVIPLPTTLLGTTVKIRDSAGTERSAPLFFVSPGQINALIPTGTVNGSAQIVITSGDGKVSTGVIQISSVVPGLFAANANGLGVAAATALRVRADNSQSFESVSTFDAAQSQFVSVPIDLGPETDQVFLVLNGTGIRGRSNLSAVTAIIGGTSARVDYAGPQGVYVGLDQINVLIPRSLAGRGEADVVLTVNGKPANAVKINIK
ncbi:MAG: choice-of-anchor D domain-containing protein [Acidobacteria bacterium]|nr:choice-of-anchor D domain-containing protein [Acidobacteriota bacterium]